jgi:hypothetical protein
MEEQIKPTIEQKPIEELFSNLDLLTHVKLVDRKELSDLMVVNGRPASRFKKEIPLRVFQNGKPIAFLSQQWLNLNNFEIDNKFRIFSKPKVQMFFMGAPKSMDMNFAHVEQAIDFRNKVMKRCKGNLVNLLEIEIAPMPKIVPPSPENN